MDRNKRVSTFAQKSAYETALDQARQQQALAEALAQQQYRPLEGGAAPTPSFAPLVMALQGYLGGRAARKAREAEAEAKGMETVAGRQIAGRVFGGAPVSDANTTPDASGLAEVAIQSQYRASPQDALRMASTPQGVAALKGNPALAAALEQSMRQPEAEEFYAPTETAEGFVQFGKRGGRKDTGVAVSTKAPQPTELARLLTERDALPPNDPRRATYDAAIASSTSSKAPVTNIDLGPKDTFKFEADLRGELKDKLKEYGAVRDSYQKIENALKTGAGDIAVVYAFAKLNDPTSVVRESEFETVAKSGSLGQRIKNLVEQAQTGKMNPELRENLRQQARQMYLAQQKQAEQIANQYRELATTYNLDPKKVLAGISIDDLAGQSQDEVIKLPPRRPR
jgi:hypothetical protein